MKITKNPTFRAPITVKMPDGDAVTSHSFIATFKSLPVSVLDAMPLGSFAERQAFLRGVIVGWDGLVDDRGDTEAPFLFTPENLTALLDDPFVLAGLLNGWAEAFAGARRGN